MGRKELLRFDLFLRLGYYHTNGELFEELGRTADMINCSTKFRLIIIMSSISSEFLPAKKVNYNLRKRKHDFVLHPKDDRHFFNIVLFK